MRVLLVSRGRVLGVQGLFVARTSVFPSADWVDPIVTVMAISRRVAKGVVAEMLGAAGAKARL